MPELLTKYPDVVKTILKDQGAKCGAGTKQQILTQCPKDQFCSLKTGEFCVYDFNQVKTMTQIEPADFTALAQTVPTIFSAFNIILLGGACLFGILFGMWLKSNK